MGITKIFPKLSSCILGEDVVGVRENPHYAPTNISDFFSKIRTSQKVNLHLYYTGTVNFPIKGTSNDEILQYFSSFDVDRIFIDENEVTLEYEEKVIVLTLYKGWEEAELYITFHMLEVKDNILNVNVASFDRKDFVLDFLSIYQCKVNSTLRNIINIFTCVPNTCNGISPQNILYINNKSDE